MLNKRQLHTTTQAATHKCTHARRCRSLVAVSRSRPPLPCGSRHHPRCLAIWLAASTSTTETCCRRACRVSHILWGCVSHKRCADVHKMWITSRSWVVPRASKQLWRLYLLLCERTGKPVGNSRGTLYLLDCTASFEASPYVCMYVCMYGTEGAEEQVHHVKQTKGCKSWPHPICDTPALSHTVHNFAHCRCPSRWPQSIPWCYPSVWAGPRKWSVTLYHFKQLQTGIR